jgi:hypothetical protein
MKLSERFEAKVIHFIMWVKGCTENDAKRIFNVFKKKKEK